VDLRPVIQAEGLSDIRKISQVVDTKSVGELWV
jgi:hypothetical protein